MLSSAQNDRLGLTFDVSNYNLLNVQIDVTSLDLDCCGAPFVSSTGAGFAPTFRFSLFEESGSQGIGAGTLLDQFDFTDTESARNIIDFSTATFGLDVAYSAAIQQQSKQP